MSSIVNAARINLLLAPVGTLLAALASVLVARWLSPENYADYATLMSLVTWLLILAEIGCNTGLGRFLKQAEVTYARGSLYNTLQLRRWLVSVTLAILLVWIGPFWAKSVGFSEDRWQPFVFLMIGLLAAIMLHGQLASSAMLSVFKHKQVLLTNQSMSITRALALIVSASLTRNPVWLVLALLIIAILEASVLHRFISLHIGHEKAKLTNGIANAAQKHGLVTLFDKLTTALSGGPFLLLVLAGLYSRVDLAMFAIATDLIQKMLSLVGLPLSNIIMPALNDSRNDIERFRLQITRLGGLMIPLFSIAIGGIITVMPLGLPLLLGPAYKPAVVIAVLWVLPVFFESGIRMVWGAALIALDQYRWLMFFNFIYGLVSLLIVFTLSVKGLKSLLMLLGILRFMMSLVLLHKVAHLGLFPLESRPLGIILVALFSCLLALSAQVYIEFNHLILALLTSIVIYISLLLLALQHIPLIPKPSYEALVQISGKYKNILLLFIPFAIIGKS